MDAVNIDLKAFSEQFYRKHCAASLEPVKETLVYLRHHTRVWLEVTTLLIPGENDSEAEIDALCSWVAFALGPDVPLHFSAFHPSYKMQAHPSTPSTTLSRARAQAQRAGLRFVYTGNVRDEHGQATVCPACGHVVIARTGYRWCQTTQTDDISMAPSTKPSNTPRRIRSAKLQCLHIHPH